MQRKYLVVTPLHEYKHEVRAQNQHKTLLGYLIMEIDGTFYWDGRVDGLSSHILREIADWIDELNRQFDERIEQEFAFQEALQTVKDL